MYTEEKIDKFIELRACGWSLGHIATDLDVSKRTLVDWKYAWVTDARLMLTSLFPLFSPVQSPGSIQ